jgi:hypothetical protein
MSVNYKIIQAKDFIKAKPSGEIDLKESKKVLGQIAEMLRLVGDYEVLVDVRDAYGNMDQADLCKLVLEFRKYRDAFRSKIAVITRDDEQFNKAVFVEMFANIDGFAILAFTDFEQAIDWLQSEGGLEDLWS